MTVFLLVFIFYAIVFSILIGFAGCRSQCPAQRRAPEPSKRPGAILIVGGTGGTGHQLIEQALSRGYLVTALVRDASRLRLTHPRLKVMRGDVLNEESVKDAMRAQDAVLCALGHKRYFGPSHILSEGTRNILNAMQVHGTKRLVCESSLGIGDSAGRMGLYYTLFVVPVILPFYFWDKTRQERLIAASPVDWVIVRPATLTNMAKRGCKHQGLNVGSYVLTPRISRSDVASFMLDQLESNHYLGVAPGISW